LGRAHVGFSAENATGDDSIGLCNIASSYGALISRKKGVSK